MISGCSILSHVLIHARDDLGIYILFLQFGDYESKMPGETGNPIQIACAKNCAESLKYTMVCVNMLPE